MNVIKIEIPQEQKKPLIDFLKLREQEVTSQVDSLQTELSGIRQTLKSLGENVKVHPVEPQRSVVNNNPIDGEYQKTWTQPHKVAYLLKKIGRPAGSGELADLLIKDYEKMDRQKAVAVISAVLTGKTTKNLFERLRNERNQYVYKLRVL